MKTKKMGGGGEGLGFSLCHHLAVWNDDYDDNNNNDDNKGDDHQDEKKCKSKLKKYTGCSKKMSHSECEDSGHFYSPKPLLTDIKGVDNIKELTLKPFISTFCPPELLGAP